MKRLLFCILLLPVMATAQGGKDIFAKFTMEGGFPVKGTSKVKGYENYAIVTDLVASSANNNRVQFSMPVSGAAGIFTNSAKSGKKLPTGEIFITSMSEGQRIVEYKITMEGIAVAEATNINATMKLVLDAARIGWTYYSNNRGKSTVSSKTGWDSEKGVAWTNF